jgi:hypothetical protein
MSMDGRGGKRYPQKEEKLSPRKKRLGRLGCQVVVIAGNKGGAIPPDPSRPSSLEVTVGWGETTLISQRLSCLGRDKSCLFFNSPTEQNKGHSKMCGSGSVLMS